MIIRKRIVFIFSLDLGVGLSQRLGKPAGRSPAKGIWMNSYGLMGTVSVKSSHVRTQNSKIYPVQARNRWLMVTLHMFLPDSLSGLVKGHGTSMGLCQNSRP